MVRAKFKVDRFEQSQYTSGVGQDVKKVIQTTVVMTPVYSSDPDHENRKFWNATPSGELKLGVINEAAAKYFSLGEEYYIDFTKASEVNYDQLATGQVRNMPL